MHFASVSFDISDRPIAPCRLLLRSIPEILFASPVRDGRDRKARAVSRGSRLRPIALWDSLTQRSQIPEISSPLFSEMGNSLRIIGRPISIVRRYFASCQAAGADATDLLWFPRIFPILSLSSLIGQLLLDVRSATMCAPCLFHRNRGSREPLSERSPMRRVESDPANRIQDLVPVNLTNNYTCTK